MDSYDLLLLRSDALPSDDAWVQLTSVSNTPTPPADAWDWLAIQSTAGPSDDAWVHLLNILSDAVTDTGEGMATLLVATMLVVAADKPTGSILAGDTIALLTPQQHDNRVFVDTKDSVVAMTPEDSGSYLENSSNKVILNL